ncbi:hypothetical protein [Pseudonocardia hydrocarbonoxydans]|uniref:hypothetical protein n=1 Tax=Pseudonocardia hydrocarbonoxydans TaxID=76726 RepID=UPI0031D0B1DC
MTSTLRLPARTGRHAATPAPPAGPIDVEEELSAQYPVAVVRELGERGLPVDTAVLHHPTRTCRPAPAGSTGLAGGTVYFALLAAPTGRLLPLCARWDGGRTWTVLTGQPDGTAVHRARLHGHHTPAPADLAEFVTELVAGACGTSRRPYPVRQLLGT